MRQIDYIVLHCTATAQNAKIESIQKYWREVMHWNSPGYHFIIEKDGTIHNLLSIELVSNGVKGFNHNSINISYIGGIDENGKPVDNRTLFQKQSQLKLLTELTDKFPNAKIQGHRDFPGVKKACPSFDVKTWLHEIGFKNY